MAPVLALALLFAAAAAPPPPPPLAAQRPAVPWWHTGVCYEVFVRSFADSDGDGVGDLRGLTARLDYINDGNPATTRDLGASCVWLMPIAPSPSYHGYDVTNYVDVNREYGTVADFRRFVAEAHRRGIRVLVDLVLNHMSSEHPYFKAALLSRESPWHDWFMWSPAQRRTLGWQAQTWHRAPHREEWYYGIFWHGMPDLNLGNPAVQAEVERIARFWLVDMDVDGFRLDAVGHFFEDGDDPRNGSGTFPFLRDFQARVARLKPAAFTIGEVWDSIGAMRPYYPDQLTAYFAFQLADSLIHAVRAGSARGLVSTLQRAIRELPDGRWGSFQRNHDQTRTMTEFGGDWARARLSATLLLTLPGIPFVYYGEEVGMTGDKRHGDPRLRTPMQWSREPGVGFTRGLPWEPLPVDSHTANVAVLERDTASLLHHYRRLIHLRTARPSLGAAAEFLPLATGNDALLAYVRRAAGAQPVIVIANLADRRMDGPTLGAELGSGGSAIRTLVGRAPESLPRVGADGRVTDWRPYAELEPHEGIVLEVRGGIR